MITIGLAVGALAESEADEMHDEDSYIDVENCGFPEPDLVTEARLEYIEGFREIHVCRVSAGAWFSHRSRRGRLTQMKTNCLPTFTAGWRRRVEESAYFFAPTPALEAGQISNFGTASKRARRDSGRFKFSINDMRGTYMQ